MRVFLVALLAAISYAQTALNYGDFSSMANMEANGWVFSHPESEYAFYAVGDGARTSFCGPNSYTDQAIPDTSYCGFAHPGVGVISVQMMSAGTVEISYGNSWGSAGNQWVTVDLNGAEISRQDGPGTNSVTFGVEANDIVSLSEIGDGVINLHSFVFTEATACQTTEIISGQASDFEGGMGGWSCYDRGTGNHGNCHTHSNYFGRSSVGHIHGGCGGSQGGIQQTFATEAGVTYTLNFLAYAGEWDGVDTDDLEIMISNSDKSDWQGFSVTQNEWNSIAYIFTATGEVTITIWADVAHCIDVDDITLSICSTCTMSDIISGQASNFEGGMGGWSCYDIGNGSPHGNCHTHSNYNDRTSVAHIHGSCGGTQGGIQQTFQTTAGNNYKLLFLAFAGEWDGVDTDDFAIMVENSDKSEWSWFSVDPEEWRAIEHSFTANGAVTITIWSDVNHCIDVDDIVLEECSGSVPVTMESCGGDPEELPMDSVTGQQSSINGDTVTIIIDYPGYMELVSLSWVGGDESVLETWTLTSTDGCRNDNSVTQDFAYAELASIISRSGQHAEFNILAGFNYYTESDVTETSAQVFQQKEIKFGISAPLTHVVSVTANLQQNAALLYDITGHGIIEDEDGSEVVYVEFRTFVTDGHSFTDCSISSTYFDTETAECTAGAVESFDHPTEGQGSVQTWSVRVKNPTMCQEATHTEQIDIDLTLAAGTVERIQFMVAMVDEVGPDCRVLLGDVDLTHTVFVSDGGEDGFINANDIGSRTYFLNSVIYFSVTFESLMTPTYATLSSMTITQSGDQKCGDDCFAAAEVVCTECDADYKSAGATYEFSVRLGQDSFIAAAGADTETVFELNFSMQYSDRRRLTKAVDAYSLPIKFSLRDYDCKAPNAILSSVKTVNCDMVSMTKKMICSADGWEDVSTCAAPGERLFSILGLAATVVAVGFLLSKFVFASKDIVRYKQVSIQVEA